MYPCQDLTHKIISAAIEVHRHLGPGLLEAVYSACLSLEFEAVGLRFEKELDIPLMYKKRKIERFLRLDYLVENEVVVEIKSLGTVLPLHEAQLLTYLKLTGKQVGLLINFNVPLLKNGIYRRILDTDLVVNQRKNYTEETETQSTLRNRPFLHSQNVEKENASLMNKKYFLFIKLAFSLVNTLSGLKEGAIYWPSSVYSASLSTQCNSKKWETI